MQWLLESLARCFCTCGARSLPLPVPTPPLSPLTPSNHADSPPTSGSLSPPSPSSSVVRAVLSHIPAHASPISPSSSTSSFTTQLPSNAPPPQRTPDTDVPGTHAPPIKSPPSRPPPRLSPTEYQAQSSASSSQQAMPLPTSHTGPIYAKAPPSSAYQIHASQIERRLGTHWAGYAFLTFSQHCDGWQTWYTDDFSRVFFYNVATGNSRWFPPPLPDDTDGSTGGT